MTPKNAAREVSTTRSRKQPTGTADTAANTSKVRVRKGCLSRYWPTGDFMKATTCGQRGRAGLNAMSEPQIDEFTRAIGSISQGYKVGRPIGKKSRIINLPRHELPQQQLKAAVDRGQV